MIRELPPLLIQHIRDLNTSWGSKLIDALSCSDSASVALRVNAAKGAKVPADAKITPWDNAGFYLPSRPNFALDPAWHQGRFYVQDASSMIISEAIRRILPSLPQNIRYLDACAAPGGKTLAAIDALTSAGRDFFVIANERDARRYNILRENIIKWGCPRVAITNNDARGFASAINAFDIIAADMPCSGEGMMRKEPEALAQWSPSLVQDCASLQRAILENLWRTLAPGGYLLYSTCTFNRHENEDNLAYAVNTLGAEIVDLKFTDFEGVQEGLFGIPAARLMPGFVDGEGLFIGVLHKPGDIINHTSISNNTPAKPSGKNRKPVVVHVPDFIHLPEDFTLTADFQILPKSHANFVNTIHKATGLTLAFTKGKDIVPSHDLAMCQGLSLLPTLELNYSTAMAYLRGEGLADIPSDLPRGYFTPTYSGYPLGIAKNVGRRANNLYPDAIRLHLSQKLIPTSAPASIIDSLR